MQRIYKRGLVIKYHREINAQCFLDPSAFKLTFSFLTGGLYLLKRNKLANYKNHLAVTYLQD